MITRQTRQDGALEDRTSSPFLATLATLDGSAGSPTTMCGETPSDAETAPQTFSLTFGRDCQTKVWTERLATFEDLRRLFYCEHDARDSKDGLCFVAATLLEGKRNLKSVEAVHLVVYDIDGEQSLNDVRTILSAADLTAFLYTTYSHKTTRTEIVAEHYEKWAKQAREAATPTPTAMRKYLDAKAKAHLKNIAFDDLARSEQVADKGICYVVDHDPVDKLRVVLPLAAPIIIAKLGSTTPKCNDAYKAIYHGIGNTLGFKFDPSCSDPTRLFYLPSCPKDKTGISFAREYDGPLLDWTDEAKFPRTTVETKTAPKSAKKETASGSKPTDDFGNLPWWGVLANDTFDVEALAEKIDAVLAQRNDGGHIITCPNEDEHSETGGTGTFCVNAENAPNGHWTIYCSHNSCQSEGRKRTDFIRQWLVDGLIKLDDLKEYSGVAVPPSKATPESVAAAISTLTNASAAADRDEVCAQLVRLEGSDYTDARKKYKERTGLTTGEVDVALKAAKSRRKADRKPRAEDGDDPFRDWNRQAERFDVFCDLVLDRLIKSNEADPRLFVMGDKLVRLKRSTLAHIRAEEVTLQALQYEIDKVAAFVMSGGKNDPRDRVITCPKEVASHILCKQSLPFAELRAITETPFFARNGDLVVSSGYHPPSMTYYAPPSGFRMFKVSDAPTKRNVARALRILHEPLIDIPFDDGDCGDGGASRANWLAKLVQPFVRDIINGCCPWYVGQKPKERTGQTLLANGSGDR